MNIFNRWEGRSTCVPHKRRHRRDLNYPGLIRHYTMERISGTTVYDETGTGNATNNGMTAGAAGVRGVCLQGGSVVSTTKNLDLGAEITFLSFSVWIQRLDLTMYSGVLFNAGANRTVQIYPTSSGGYVSCYNGGWVTGDLVVADTNWHHVVGIIESTNNIRLYVDGQKAANTLAINSGVVRYFGRPNTISGQEACSIDNLRLYNTMLSEYHVKELFDEFR